MAVQEVWTPEQVADFLGLNVETVRRYIRSGELIASRLGRRYRIPRRNVELLLAAKSTGAKAHEALFERVAEIAERKRVPLASVEADVSEAVRAVRQQ